MKRLCKRTSKCSLESLSTCGERNTQKRLIFVGNATNVLLHYNLSVIRQIVIVEKLNSLVHYQMILKVYEIS